MLYLPTVPFPTAPSSLALALKPLACVGAHAARGVSSRPRGVPARRKTAGPTRVVLYLVARLWHKPGADRGARGVLRAALRQRLLSGSCGFGQVGDLACCLLVDFVFLNERRVRKRELVVLDRGWEIVFYPFYEGSYSTLYIKEISTHVHVCPEGGWCLLNTAVPPPMQTRDEWNEGLLS